MGKAIVSISCQLLLA